MGSRREIEDIHARGIYRKGATALERSRHAVASSYQRDAEARGMVPDDLND
jgi:hypothetical protein